MNELTMQNELTMRWVCVEGVMKFIFVQVDENGNRIKGGVRAVENNEVVPTEAGFADALKELQDARAKLE